MKKTIKKIIRFIEFPFIFFDYIKFYKSKDNRFVFNLKEFSLIPEKNGSIIYNATEKDLINENYACGCFHFIKN